MTPAPIVIISGMIAGDPHQGGATWAVLQYVLGFKRLGWQVLFIEPIQSAKLQPTNVPLADSVNARYFQAVVESFGLEGQAALLLAGTHQTIGLEYDDLLRLARGTQLLINISGMLTDAELYDVVPVRLYLDLDPGFVQIWHEQKIDMRFEGHTHFATVGQLVGTTDSMIPTCGSQWFHTLPPVVLERWPVSRAAPSLGLTTVGNWRAYGSVQYKEHYLGQKVHSIRNLMDLPSELGEPVLLAMNIDPAESKDLAALQAGGWNLVDPLCVAGSPREYQDFIVQSKAEIGITKAGYIASRSGWFSDRSACYLATGRPVVAQETGWSSVLPAGEGLFSFDTMDQAVSAVAEINRDPVRHAIAARTVAEQYLDSDRVLKKLIFKTGAGQ